jgi:hypothetical protein
LARNSAAAQKKWNRKTRAVKNSFPPTPFLFARPSNWILKFGIRIFVEKCSNINQKTPHLKIRWKQRDFFMQGEEVLGALLSEIRSLFEIFYSF